MPVITATVVLHNIATMLSDIDPPEDKQLDEFLTSVRQRGLRVEYDAVEISPPAAGTSVAATAMRKAVIDSHFTGRH